MWCMTESPTCVCISMVLECSQIVIKCLNCEIDVFFFLSFHVHQQVVAQVGATKCTNGQFLCTLGANTNWSFLQRSQARKYVQFRKNTPMNRNTTCLFASYKKSCFSSSSFFLWGHLICARLQMRLCRCQKTATPLASCPLRGHARTSSGLRSNTPFFLGPLMLSVSLLPETTWRPARRQSKGASPLANTWPLSSTSGRPLG